MTENASLTERAGRPRIDFDVVVLDTDDPPRLAEFYTALLGWQITDVDDDWITIAPATAGGARMAFQLAVNHTPPTWPANEVPQQIHLDLRVDNMEEAGRYAESIGGRPVPGAGVPGNFVVYLDPSGHPFCFCL